LAGRKLLALDARAALHHLHVVGPTGTGKSTLLGNLILQDIEDGRAVVVIEPKGDLVADVLARIPDSRTGDVVLLDPTDRAPGGLNPLSAAQQTGANRSPELATDSILAVFRQLYGEAIGPRSADILHAGLLTLAQRSDASLVMLPLLLTNASFRRSLTAKLRDPIALGPFWAAYENWSEPERAAAIAPVMNKLRPLLRPSVRAVLGQRSPRFQLRQVFTERKILLVPLSRGQLGPEAARLLGSLLVAQLWQVIQGRSAITPERRHPVMVYIDEVQDFLHLPTDIGEALAQARGLGVGFTLAHQFLGQLSPELRSGMLANARSRICFQLAHEDAVHMSKGHAELEPADFTALGRYEIYASLFSGGQVTPYASGITRPAGDATADVESIRATSRQRYGRSLDEIEAGFADLLQPAAGDLGVTGRRRKATS
jgi:type IV secretory pathway TraG/TraD family ATPase VirD4